MIRVERRRASGVSGPGATRPDKEVLMSYDWGPHYIVPSELLKEFSGIVKLREQLDEYLP